MKRIFRILSLFILACILCGCSRNQTQGKGNGADAMGTMFYGYFYQEDGIFLTTYERFMYSGWDAPSFEYICTDLTCSHKQEDCSAKQVSGDEDIVTQFGLYYDEKLVIVVSRGKYEFLNGEDENVKITEDVYTTDVYEADPDGSNRRKVASFAGSGDRTNGPFSALLVGSRLYFGGPTKKREETTLNKETGEMSDLKIFYDDAIYCVNLEDYSVQTYAETKEKSEDVYLYNMHVYDGYVYAIESDTQNGKGMWYRIDPQTDECKEIAHFDGDIPWFIGAIDDTVYYNYSGDNHIYSLGIADSKEETLISLDEGMEAYAVVIDRQLVVETDESLEEGNYSVEYTLFDQDGNAGEVYQYDDYFTFADVIGDRIVFIKPFSEKEEWWCEKGDFAGILEKGTYIGDFIGASHDQL